MGPQDWVSSVRRRASHMARTCHQRLPLRLPPPPCGPGTLSTKRWLPFCTRPRHPTVAAPGTRTGAQCQTQKSGTAVSVSPFFRAQEPFQNSLAHPPGGLIGQSWVTCSLLNRSRGEGSPCTHLACLLERAQRPACPGAPDRGRAGQWLNQVGALGVKTRGNGCLVDSVLCRYCFII